MLQSSNSSTPTSSLPKLAANGSNSIIWKTQMQLFLGAKNAAQSFDNSIPPPNKPQPSADGADDDMVKKYEKEREKYLEWLKADTEACHYIASTIPDSLLVKTINNKMSTELWKAICSEHEGKTHTFRMEMICQIHNEQCTDADDVCTHFANMV